MNSIKTFNRDEDGRNVSTTVCIEAHGLVKNESDQCANLRIEIMGNNHSLYIHSPLANRIVLETFGKAESTNIRDALQFAIDEVDKMEAENV